MAAVSIIVDAGPAGVRAVCRFSAGMTMPLVIEGAVALPALVFVHPSDGLLTGGEAVTCGWEDPQRLVKDPMDRLVGPPVDVAGRSIDPVDLMAALIVRCAVEAQAATATVDLALTLAVPAGWGPRRRELLRVAAQRAGFTEVELIATPLAAVVYATRTVGVPVPVDGLAVVCDVDATRVSASVLHRRGDTDWDTLSSVNRVLPALPDRPATPPAKVHTGPMAPTDPHTVGDAAGPVAAATATALNAITAQVVVEAIDAADVDPAFVSTVLVVGDLPEASGLDKAVADLTGLAVTIPIRADEATVLGAASVTGSVAPEVWRGGWAPIPAPDLRWTQVAAAAVAGAGSLLLLMHVLATVYRHQVGIYVDYVLVNSGEFVMACVLVMVTAMTIARGLVLGRIAQLAEAQRPEQTSLPQQILGSAAAIGVTVSIIYALLLAIVAGKPAGSYVGTAVVAVAPITVFAAVIVALLPRLEYLGGNALRQLQTSITAIVLAAGGVALVTWSYTSSTGITADVAARGGGAVVGVACAWQLTRRFVARLVALPLAGLVGALAAGAGTENVYGFAFVFCVQAWWLWQTVAILADGFPRLWSRARRRPPATPPPIRQPIGPPAVPAPASSGAAGDQAAVGSGSATNAQEAAHGPG